MYLYRYAELLADNRTFTEEEDSYFSEQAQYAYESFRNKAALSRGMQNEQMQEYAQVASNSVTIQSTVRAACSLRRHAMAVCVGRLPVKCHMALSVITLRSQIAHESSYKASETHGSLVMQFCTYVKGRVWSGKRALEVGLVDALGGLSRAVAIAKKELKIPDSDNVALIELSREQMSPLMLLTGGASATGAVSDIVQVRLRSS